MPQPPIPLSYSYSESGLRLSFVLSEYWGQTRQGLVFLRRVVEVATGKKEGDLDEALPGSESPFEVNGVFDIDGSSDQASFVARSLGPTQLAPFSVPSSVPEPMTLCLLALGALGLGAVARRRRA
jgi:hypothetical protein